mmetsp:Transcript_103070/g.188055  ORF Transcript_103070/g.188055 Transcript_103070/m.188055 type:complete len:779 (-) Transcript_103070:37-2373(-)
MGGSSSLSACSTLEFSRAASEAGAQEGDEDEEDPSGSSDDDSSATELRSFSAPSRDDQPNVSGSESAAKQLLLEMEKTGNKDGALSKDYNAVYQDGEEREPFIRFSDLARPFVVFKDGLFTNPEVMVRVGPVIGKVTDTSAVVLLEVGTYSEVSLNFAPICGNVEVPGEYQDKGMWQQDVSVSTRNLDTMVFTAAGSVSVCHIMEPGRPCTFAVWGLEPATCYLVLLSNVSQIDRDTRIARFRTMPERVESLRLVAISGQTASRQELGDASPWISLVDLARTGPEVQLVLHVGCTVDAAPAMAEAADCLKDYASFKEGPRRDQERRACEALRSAYCEAWGHEPGLQRLLSEVGSHLTVFAPPCELDSLLRQLGVAEESAETEEWRALLRASLDIYYEYQRSLWHDASDSGFKPLRRPPIAAEGEESLEELDERASFEFWQNVGGWSQGVVEEWHFHKYGRIGIFMLDTKGNRFRADGRLAAMNAQKINTWPLISSQQWTALKDAMQEDSMQVLVLASDIPFFGETPDIGQQNANQNQGDKRKSGNLFDWCARPKELGALLKMVFEWKQDQYPAREAVLVSGGHSFGTSGDVCDHQYGLNCPLVVTGPVLGPVNVPQNVTLHGSVAGRFSYVYRAPEQHCNYCTVDIDLEMNPQKPTVDVQLYTVPLPPQVQFLSVPDRAGSIPLIRWQDTLKPVEPQPEAPQGGISDIKSASLGDGRSSLSGLIHTVQMKTEEEEGANVQYDPFGGIIREQKVDPLGGMIAGQEHHVMRQSEVLRLLS